MQDYSHLLKIEVPDTLPTHHAHIIIYYPENQTKDTLFAFLHEQYHLQLQPLTTEEELPSLTLFINEQWVNVYFIPISFKGNVYFNLKSKTAASIKKIKSAAIHLDLTFIPSDHLPAIQAILTGIYLGKYENQSYKGENRPAQFCEISFSHHSLQTDLLKEYLTQAQILATTSLAVCDLVNGPANIITPDYMVKAIRHLCSSTMVTVNVLTQKELEAQGFHALLAVGQGSEHNVYFVTLEYQPNSTFPTIGLAGKGVTFDTGGISIKDAQNLHYMKTDMAGAAAVLGAVVLAAKTHLPINIIAALPICENSVSAQAFKPGDIIKSYSGKTIEIINTDAEGRLILADALSFLVSNYKVDYLVDLATLTGACVRALGYHAAGIFTNNDDLAQALDTAGKISGELLWRLPLWDQYKNSLDSALADVKNLEDVPVAGAISAAKFLEYFTNQHLCYAHLDIAGVAFKNVDWSKEKSATAFGVNLLWHWFNQIKSK